MALKRTIRSQGTDLSETARSIAEQLRHECFILLEIYKKKETFTSKSQVANSRLVSVSPPSSQLDTRDKLWQLHSALLKCHKLLVKAIAKEVEELGDGKGEYETQRKIVKERLWLLKISTWELLKAIDGTVQTPSEDESESDHSVHSVFDLKLWIFCIFKEVDYWTKMTIATLEALPEDISKENVRTKRGSRNALS